MKKILLCMALSVVSFAIAVGSFLTNDVASYKHYLFENMPSAAEKWEKKERNAKHIPDKRLPLIQEKGNGARMHQEKEHPVPPPPPKAGK